MSNADASDSNARMLLAKLTEWQDLLDGDDRLAIWRQIGAMLWWSAFYRSINESRKFIPDAENGARLANGSLHQLIDEGYVTRHAVAIRRLLDSRRGTNSLINLIRDIKRHARLLARGNMLEARGLVYDYEPIKEQRRLEAYQEAKEAGKNAYHFSGEGWAQAESWHLLCDDLCGRKPRTRKPSDQPSPQRFQQLIDDLTRAGRAVEEYVNNYIAHAAPPDRRESLLPEYRSLSLTTLWKAERAVVRVASFVSRCIVHGSDRGNVPIPQFDQFQYLDRPIVTHDALEPMHSAWKTHSDQIEQCRGWTWDLSLDDEQVAGSER
jgi:hypothetical protein